MLEKENSIKVRGLAAVCVMLSHFLMREDIHDPILKMINDGSLWVGVFFFLSGYGLQWNEQKKQNYLKAFLPKKFIGIYIPFLIAEVVCTVLSVWSGNEIAGVPFFLSCIGLRLTNDTLWYVWHILICYILFYGIKRWIPRKMEPFVWTGCYVLYLMLCVVFDVGNWWYLSTSLFLIGLWIASNKEQYQEMIRKWRFLINGIFFLFFIVLQLAENQVWALPGIPMNMWITAIRMIVIPFFGIWLDYCITWLTERRKKETTLQSRIGFVFSLLGMISYEIYLWHITVIQCLSSFLPIGNKLVRVSVISFVTFLVAYVMNRMNAQMKQFLLGVWGWRQNKE